MKNFNPRKLALMGLFTVLAFNMSYWWTPTESGSSSFASNRDRSDSRRRVSEGIDRANRNAFDRCVRDAMATAPSLNSQMFNCEIKHNGNLVEFTGELKKVKKGTSKSTSGNETYTTKEGQLVREGQLKAEDKVEAEEYALVITAAVNKDCYSGDCFQDRIVENICPNNDNNCNELKIEMGKHGSMADKTLGKIKDILDVVDAAEQEHHEDEVAKEEIDRNWRKCKETKSGDDIKTGSDEFKKCLKAQLRDDDNDEEDLAKIINKRLFPWLMNKAFSKSEDAQEEIDDFLDIIADAAGCEESSNGYLKGCDDDRSRFLAGTYNNFKDFQNDMKKRNLVLSEFYRRLRLSNPQMSHETIDAYMSQFEQSYIDRYVTPRMNSEMSRTPEILHEQFAMIGSTLKTGKAPMSTRYETFSGGYQYGDGFSRDQAWRALGLDDRDPSDISSIISNLYPNYDVNQRSAGNTRIRNGIDNVSRKLSELDAKMRNSRSR
ncbi:MAG: hypothetical protein KDD58_00680 [Bdellovibrionales bacterium]|nr:hypothetical protein [Bdellovibrionales bacterium]